MDMPGMADMLCSACGVPAGGDAGMAMPGIADMSWPACEPGLAGDVGIAIPGIWDMSWPVPAEGAFTERPAARLRPGCLTAGFGFAADMFIPGIFGSIGCAAAGAAMIAGANSRSANRFMPQLLPGAVR